MSIFHQDILSVPREDGAETDYEVNNSDHLSQQASTDMRETTLESESADAKSTSGSENSNLRLSRKSTKIQKGLKTLRITKSYVLAAQKNKLKKKSELAKAKSQVYSSCPVSSAQSTSAENDSQAGSEVDTQGLFSEALIIEKNQSELSKNEICGFN